MLYRMQPIELTDNQTTNDQATSGEHTLPDISQGKVYLTYN